jgi:hypothetical protein
MKLRLDWAGMALIFVGFLIIFTVGLRGGTGATRLGAILGGVAGVAVGGGLLVLAGRQQRP